MAENSKIEWTHHTFNPWFGCTKVSEGCAHCYAEQSSPAKVARSKGHETWGKGAQRSRTSDANWKEPLKWDRDAAAAWENWTTAVSAAASDSGPMPERPRVFCASLADWLDDEVPIEWLADLLKLIMRTPHLDWLLLTKRPHNFRPRLESVLKQFPRNCLSEDEAMLRVRIEVMLAGWSSMKHTHPKLGCENYWIGTTVENQARADERIPQLLSIPAKVRFLSCEPLLSKVDLVLDEERLTGGPDDESVRTRIGPHGIHWVICGGESGGPKARPMHPNWARSLRDQCSAAGVPFFFKQWGDWAISSDHCDGKVYDAAGALNDGTIGNAIGLARMTLARVGKKKAGGVLDGRTHDEFPQVERRAAA